MRKAYRGFTLIEILIVVMLTGMVTTLALAPVIMTVRQVVEIQDDWADTEALSRTLAFIGRDAAAAVRFANPAVIITPHERLGGGNDDTLIVMTTTPTRQMLGAGSVVYKLVEGGPLHGNALPGLYRWVLQGVLPQDVKTDKLTVNGNGDLTGRDRSANAVAQLVLPWATEFSVAIPQLERDKHEWTKRYSGELPKGLYLALTRGGNRITGEKGETREDVIVFP